MKQITIIRNVAIEDLLYVLEDLSKKYNTVDIVSDPETGTIIINPIQENKLTDEDILKLI
jgi:hypothetical protein